MSGSRKRVRIWREKGETGKYVLEELGLVVRGGGGIRDRGEEVLDELFVLER